MGTIKDVLNKILGKPADDNTAVTLIKSSHFDPITRPPSDLNIGPLGIRDGTLRKHMEVTHHEGYPTKDPNDCIIAIVTPVGLSSLSVKPGSKETVLVIDLLNQRCIFGKNLVTWHYSEIIPGFSSVACSYYAGIIQLCRLIGKRSIMKYDFVRLISNTAEEYIDIVFSHTPEAERFYTKMWMDVCGSFETGFLGF